MVLVSDSLQARLKVSEGYRAKPYKDILGVHTIGYGFTSLSREVCDVALKMKLDKIASQLNDKIKHLSKGRQEVLIEMAYNVGVDGLLKFTDMWKAINMSDYNDAAYEIMDSDAARLLPGRYARLARGMKA